MRAVEELRAEHCVIMQHLDALETLAAALAAGRPIEPAELRHEIRAVRELSGRHARREERVLFAALVERGFDRRAAPLAVLIAEHQEADRLLESLAVCGVPLTWTHDELRLVFDLVRAYVTLLRRHIRREETNLFPIAEVHVPPHVLARFERLAATETGASGPAARAPSAA
jgi:hemerythrin-like domain-containing protein